MCESNAYILKDGSEKLIMESVGNVTFQGDYVSLKSIFGEETRLKGRLIELNLIGHRILLESEEET
jgi:predicted RNA-binding protein|uniref:CooT family nickel-binding protein n=1 Tax=Desulfomonile tiedjei TaxID=2358 RepID=A0A7C4ARQ5_9BACT